MALLSRIFRRGATIFGRITIAGTSSKGPAMVLAAKLKSDGSYESWREVPAERCAIGEPDGSYSLSIERAGTFQITALTEPLRFGEWSSAYRRTTDQPVHLKPGESRELNFDLESVRPKQVLTCDGPPFVRLSVLAEADCAWAGTELVVRFVGPSLVLRVGGTFLDDKAPNAQTLAAGVATQFTSSGGNVTAWITRVVDGLSACGFEGAGPQGPVRHLTVVRPNGFVNNITLLSEASHCELDEVLESIQWLEIPSVVIPP